MVFNNKNKNWFINKNVMYAMLTFDILFNRPENLGLYIK